jgi:hypothetical protein
MNLQEAKKEMYKCHLGNSIFNIDKLEALIEKLFKEQEKALEDAEERRDLLAHEIFHLKHPDCCL